MFWWIFVGIFYFFVGMGCGLQMNERGAAEPACVIGFVLWPIMVGLTIGDHAGPSVEANFGRQLRR